MDLRTKTYVCQAVLRKQRQFILCETLLSWTAEETPASSLPFNTVPSPWEECGFCTSMWHLTLCMLLDTQKGFSYFMAIIQFCTTLGGKGVSFHNPFVGSRQSLWVPSLSIQPCWADCLWFTCQRWRKTHCNVLTTAQPLPTAGLISIFFRTPKLLDCHPETYRSLRSVRPENVVQLHTLAVIMRCLEMGGQ